MSYNNSNWPVYKLSDPKVCTFNPRKKEISSLPDEMPVSFVPMAKVDDISGLMDASMEKYHAWFGRYVRPFFRESGQGASAMALKIVHSQRVRREITEIGRSEGLGPDELFLARITGLFHDVGRFEQFRRFHTFVDAESIDHALLSCKVLEKERVLEDLSREYRSIVLDAVFYHNKLEIPGDFKGLKRVICNLIRDADKLDILRVFDDMKRRGETCGAAGLGLPESREISQRVVDDVLQGMVVNFRDVRTSADFLVMRLSWLYDINFPHTLEKIQMRGYLENMAQELSTSPWGNRIIDRINGYLRNRLGK